MNSTYEGMHARITIGYRPAHGLRGFSARIEFAKGAKWGARYGMEVILEGVRSFTKTQRVPLRSLTLLVGENSSGKSTFLSVVSAVMSATSFPGKPRFNEPPYNLGNFDTIATQSSSNSGREAQFKIGFGVRDGRGLIQREAVATYISKHGNVTLAEFQLSSLRAELSLEVINGSLAGRLHFTDGRGSRVRSVALKGKLEEDPPMGRQSFHFRLMGAVIGGLRRSRSSSAGDVSANPRVQEIARAARPPFLSSFSSAPIRSKPRRTYDELGEEYSPEGDHIPTLLARLLRQDAGSTDGKRVKTALERFGHESGLFKKINVKRLGRNMTDPFQIQVAGAGRAVNLSDVGYGVSQALPIIVQSVLTTTEELMLLQQPEVHLHPRAQAALGTFFVDLVQGHRRMVLIETHSDYLLDRVRQEVAAGQIAPEDVMILFFDKPMHETTVYPITLDAAGNVENAPQQYRSFFLREELNLLGRGSV